MALRNLNEASSLFFGFRGAKTQEQSGYVEFLQQSCNKAATKPGGMNRKPKTGSYFVQVP
jgi:hypothetical protein